MDIDKLRVDTPGVKNVLHFNNAGSSLMPAPVYNAVSEYFYDEYQIGGYETANKYKQKLGKFYQNISNLINARPNEIAFLENATYAWDMAFHSINFEKGDRILTSTIDYESNFISYIQVQKIKKIEVEVIPATPTGEVDPELLEIALKKGGVRLISITHIPTNGGIVNSAEEVGEIAEKYGVLYLLDACQSAGQYPLDVAKLKCHFLSVTGRKYLRGPRGTGFLYVNSDIIDDIEPHTLDLHSAQWVGENRYVVKDDAKKFEKWETNFAGKYGLSVAVEYLLDLGIENAWKRIQNLAANLRTKLNDIPTVEVLDMGVVKSGIVIFSSSRLESHDIRNRLFEVGINTSVAEMYTFKNGSRNINYAIRASVHYFNTNAEIDTFIDELQSILQSRT